MPRPSRAEAVEEANILEEIRIDPETRRDGEDGKTEDDQTDDSHKEEESEKTQAAHRQIPDTQAHRVRPQREHDNSHHSSQRERGEGLLAPLRALVHPHVVAHVLSILLLLDSDRPESLNPLRLLAVVVASMRVNLTDAQGEERERKELEDILGALAVGDGWEERVLGASLLVFGRADGTNGAFD
jgi:hypothetical protein